MAIGVRRLPAATAQGAGAPPKRWRMRRRLTLVVAFATGAPTVAIAYWVVTWWASALPVGTILTLVAVWSSLVALAATWYGTVAARHLIGPLEALATSLRRFDPSLGDAAHAALATSAAEPYETAAVRQALRQAVDRIARDRAQKEAVLGSLMHDLKTPLVAQSLLIDRLNRGGEEERATIVVELARSSRGAVARLNRIVDVLRVDSPDLGATRSRLEVREIVEDVVADLGPLIAARTISLRVSGSWRATIDRDAVQRAVENVVANAVRYARSSVAVEVLGGVVRVSDDGPGFAEPFDELVDPFRPGPVSAERPAGSAGLGLYIARRSLEASGGRLKLEASAPGRTVVLLYLQGAGK